jgi:hypothetical protein
MMKRTLSVKRRMCIAAVAIPLSLGVAMNARAATIVWAGSTDNSFTNASNWPSSILPNYGTDIMRFDGPGSQGNATITNVNLTMTNTGTAPGTTLAQLLFSGSTPAMTLTGGTITLGSAATNTYNNAILLSSGSAVTQTIGSNLVIDDGKAYTASVVNSSTTAGGLLKFTGNITGGTGAATPGAVAFNFGNTATHNGNYEAAGNINKGGAASIAVTKRGNGTLTLTGTNVVFNLGNNEAGSTIRINGGQTNILNASTNGFGVGIQSTAVVRVSAGELNTFDSRNVRNSILVDGGTWNLGQAYNEAGVLQSNTTGGARFSFYNGSGAATTAHTFTLSSGTINFLPAYSSSNFGIRFGNDNGPSNVTATAANEPTVAASQTGGTFIVNGAGGGETTFSLGTGTADKTNSYSLSGGTLDIRGTGSNGFLMIGAGSTGTSQSTFTLSGSGKLIVRSQTTVGTPPTPPAVSSNSGIQGRNTGGVQVLALSGGTLAAGRIDATNLRASAAAANGVIVNNGTIVAPGDSNRTGLTRIVGDMQISTGVLDVDINGVVQSTIWQSALNAANHDALLVTGNLTLGGDLNVRLLNAYDPTGLSFTVAQAGTLSGAFSNVAFGTRLNVLGGQGSFLVTRSGNDVVLTNFQPIPEPASLVAVGVLGTLALRRRSRCSG